MRDVKISKKNSFEREEPSRGGKKFYKDEEGDGVCIDDNNRNNVGVVGHGDNFREMWSIILNYVHTRGLF